MNPNNGKSNPIYVIAAIAVIIFAVVVVAAVTGLIPNTFSKSQSTELVTPAAPDPAVAQPAPPAPTIATAPPAAVAEEKAPAPKPIARKPAPKPAEQVALNQPKLCRDCGVIEAVNTVQAPSDTKGVLGAIAGGVVGGVLGHQVGGGRGNDVATAAGAIGGAVAGNQIEKKFRKKTEYDVVVRLEDNTAQTVHFQTEPGFQIGERVKLVNGQIVRN
jgi:outer membrane lipoprotein SlyB